MKSILLKDLRLSLDALLPWALIVGGLLAAMIVLALLPREMRPEFAWHFTLVDVLTSAVGLVALSAVGVSAWSAVSVAQGDRRHGAWLLDWSLPISAARRAGSKIIAVLIAAAAPACVVLVAMLVARWASTRGIESEGFISFVVYATAIAGVVGSALALGVAPLVHGSFKVVCIALLLGLAGALTGTLGGWLTFDSATGAYRALDPQSHILESTRQGMPMVAAIAGTAAMAVVAGAWGVRALGRPLGTRALWVGLAVGVVVALITGGVATSLWAGREMARRDEWTTALLQARAMSDAELANEIRELDARRRAFAASAPPEKWTSGVRSWLTVGGNRTLEEAGQRLRARPVERRFSSPLGEAMRAALDVSTLRLATSSQAFATLGDPNALDLKIASVLRYPHERWFRYILLDELRFRNAGTLSPGYLSSRARRTFDVDAELRTQALMLLRSDVAHRQQLSALLRTLPALESETTNDATSAS